MKTRSGVCYLGDKRKRDFFSGAGERNIGRKKIRPVESRAKARDLFDELPDDMVTCILCKLSNTASSPADFISVLLTCKRLNKLGLNSMVLAKSSVEMLSIRAKNWCESAHNFLKKCADSGNVEACYTLGMIRFYCLQNRGGGASLMAKAAINSHASALYSLSVIQFNGSGGHKTDKDLRAGVALCARAAFFGHVDALRELGHCLQDGYGVHRNISEGRRFLVQANARELAAVLSAAMCSGRGKADLSARPPALWTGWGAEAPRPPPTWIGWGAAGLSAAPSLPPTWTEWGTTSMSASPSLPSMWTGCGAAGLSAAPSLPPTWTGWGTASLSAVPSLPSMWTGWGAAGLSAAPAPTQGGTELGSGHVLGTCPLLSDFGCVVPARKAHPANQFLTDWFAGRGEGGLRMCSHDGCGRPETRRHEFRRCSVCGAVNYCSRACQALDWKMRHKAECMPMERWVDEDGNVNRDGVGDVDVEG